MARSYRDIQEQFERLRSVGTVDELCQRLSPEDSPKPPRVPGGSKIHEHAVEKRWQLVNGSGKAEILDGKTRQQMEAYGHNIENFIGTLKMPIGLAGPLRIHGFFAAGDYYVPLATTEAALVASYNRGAHVITEAGGCKAVLVSEGVSRAPGFAFEDLRDVMRFMEWASKNVERFREVAGSTTNHGALEDMQATIEGNRIYLRFIYSTGDAAGQNMVTIATQAVYDYILEHSPVQPKYSFIEANLSGDKKASAQSFLSVRGKKVTAEVTLPKDLVEKRLHTTPQQMQRYWSMSALGGVMSGTIGVHGHYANGLAALYLACGQDVACVAESSVGVTRLELNDEGDLYASVTLPNLIVGTVGGGTGLPSQKACLDILGLAGSGHARAFAEVAASIALAGEISIQAAISANHFTKAHKRLARGK